MSKAEELYQTFYNLIEHKLNEKYSKYEKDVVNELVNIAEKFVDEQNKTIEKTSYLMGFVDGKSQNKLPSDEEIKKLEHHKDYTCGLWATDRPDLINDPKKLLFEIKY